MSLGFFCSTALELKRYGFRDGSYPFDWVICGRLESVLNLLDSGFDEVLESENLARDAVRPNIVHDLRLGIDLYHDFDPDQPIEDQLDVVRAKYERRLRRLERAMAERTLFVRYIAGPEEFAYLEENMSSVLARLRRSNPGNGLLLVGDTRLPPECSGIHVHRVAVDEDDVVAREFVSKNRRLHRTLLLLRYPWGRRLRNYRRYRRDVSSDRPLSVSLRSGARRALTLVLGADGLTRLVARVRRYRPEPRQTSSSYNGTQPSDPAERQEP